ADVQRVEVRDAAGRRLAEAKLDIQGFAAELTLRPGDQEFRFLAKTAEDQSVEVPLPVKYLPIPPNLNLVEPRNNLSLKEGTDEREVEIKGQFSRPDEFQPFQVLMQ